MSSLEVLTDDCFFRLYYYLPRNDIIILSTTCTKQRKLVVAFLRSHLLLVYSGIPTSHIFPAYSHEVSLPQEKQQETLQERSFLLPAQGNDTPPLVDEFEENVEDCFYQVDEMEVDYDMDLDTADCWESGTTEDWFDSPTPAIPFIAPVASEAIPYEEVSFVSATQVAKRERVKGC